MTARRLPDTPAELTARAACVVGLAIVASLAALDASWSDVRVITATVVLGPFVTALAAGPRATAGVGAVAVAVAIASGVWNDNFGEVDYVVRTLVVIAGALFAVIGARDRARLRRDHRRFRLLTAVSEVADASDDADTTMARLTELLAPGFVDAARIDLTGTDRAAGGPVVETDGDRATLVVALRARGRQIGALELTVADAARRPFDASDLAFARVLSDRVALALDAAGLFSELESLEARQAAALDGLAEAVTVQAASGELVYANAAAARALGFASVRELLDTPTGQHSQGFDAFLEDGTPLDLDMLPGRQALAGRTPEPVLIRAIDRRTGVERWRIVKATSVLGRDGSPRMAVNVIEDITDAKHVELTQRFLAQAGAALSSSLDYERTLAELTRLAVPQIADWCAVTLPDADGALRAVAVSHVDPERVRFARAYQARYPSRVGDDSGVAEVLRTGTSFVLNGVDDALLRETITDDEQLAALRSIGMRAVMAVPMVAAGGVIGVISFVAAESGRAFGPLDVELAEELGRRAGTAVENARLYTERSQIAQTLQEGLLPDALPEVDGLRLASLYRAAGAENVVGGDFYDAFPTAAGWMAVIGDVTGRGAPAAALTGQARHTLRTAGTLLGAPATTVEELNRALVQRSELSICTVACLLVRTTGNRAWADVVLAGHPRPVLVRDGRARVVGTAGPMVGAWPDGSWSPTPVELEPGDLLVLYTDGVLDAVGATGRFGERRLLETLHAAEDAEDAVRRVREALDRFEHGAQSDDTAALVLQWTGADIPVRAGGLPVVRAEEAP